MIDRPDAQRLLRAMAETLTEEVLPATSGGARHSARVVANLCRILERELETGAVARETSRTEIGALLDRDLSLAELALALDERLRTADPEFEAEAHGRLLADVERRLAIGRPGYAE